MNEFLDIYIIFSIEQYTIVFIYGCWFHLCWG